MTFQSLETLHCKMISQRDDGADTNLLKGDAEKDLLRVLSHKAESVSKEPRTEIHFKKCIKLKESDYTFTNY